jgi:hypothetical protein
LLWHIQKFLNKETITFEIHEVVAQRLALAATGGTGYCPKAEKVQSQKNA